MNFKGVILACSSGNELMPLTRATNKYLLTVGGKPMIQHGVEKLVEAGITEILVVMGGEQLGSISEFLGSGKDFGCAITYRVQDKDDGFANALLLADGFVFPDEGMCVVCGDNIFDAPLKILMEGYNGGDTARVVLHVVPDPERFSVASIVFEGDVKNGRIIKIEDKPNNPETQLAVTGVCFYDSNVFDHIRSCGINERPNINDINGIYVDWRKMEFVHMPGWWTDVSNTERYKLANEAFFSAGGCGGACEHCV